MKNKKLKSIFVISLLLLVIFMMVNMFSSYFNIKKTAENSIANQNIVAAKSIAASMDTETYKLFLENPIKNKEYLEIKHYLEDAREKNGALHVYTLVVDSPKVSRAMIVAMPEEINEEFPIGGICTVPEEQVEMANKGLIFSTDIIADPVYGDYLTVGVPIEDQSGGNIGYLAIDISAEVINNISGKALNSSISSLVFNGLFVILMLASFLALQNWYRGELKKEVGDTEDTYQLELQSLISSVQSLRHDFSNHIQVLHGLLKLEKHDKALDYLTILSKEVHLIESIKLDVSNPGLSVLLQTKKLSAQNHNIDIHFDVLNGSFNTIKTTDLIKLLSNLIDNAIEAALELPEQERKMKIVCKVVSNNYIFEITNTGPAIKEKDKQHIFKSGFSTKKIRQGKMRGQGLFIVKEVVSRYGGGISIDSNKNQTVVRVEIPINQGKIPPSN
ncbi:GHKL domain-containing protein [Peribacillus saganii]|uniref:GHKL domain-containing protein n=1 Tax=Peribacillus saganii TaxID=2303992 RepID=A0A372LST4_9BACI|nr:ATP-binding protein [Peribacillus saganii]RFU71248.1 GHKL domain-containing protein [Peribacillus saganii]